MRSRLAFVIAALPLAFYAYACSSDPEQPPPVEDPDGGSIPDRDSGNDPPDVITQPDTGTPDTGTPVTCVGNPLTADGGAGDAGGPREIARNNGAFNDGPVWVAVGAGNLVYSEFFNGRVVRVAPDGGTPQAVITPGANLPIGNAMRGAILLTTLANGTIRQTNPGDGTDGGASIPTAPAVNPNDLVVGPGNNVYFTDPRYQSGNVNTGIYRATGAGQVTPIKQYADGTRVNGIALSPDNLTLYVGVTEGGTGKRVFKLPVAIDGSVNGANEGAFLGAAALADNPDGLAVDVAGNVYVSEAAAGGGQSGRVEVFTPAAQKIGELRFTNERPTGVAFGGADNKTLYITTENAVYVYRTFCAGVP